MLKDLRDIWSSFDLPGLTQSLKRRALMAGPIQLAGAWRHSINHSSRLCASETGDAGVEFAGDLFGGSFGREGNRRTDGDANFAGAGEAPAGEFHVPEAVNAQRHRGKAQIFRQQADAALKGMQLSVGGEFAFGEHQDAVAAVHGLARKPETLAKAGPLRQRKHIEQADNEPVA